jgi:hypothetical protein
MTNQSSVEDDVAYLKQLAQAGEVGVPDGGKHFLLWAVVVAAGLSITYGAVSGSLPLDERALNYVWGAALALGWIGSVLVGRANAMKAEGVRFANRIATATWIATGIGLTAVWLGLMTTGSMTQAIMTPIAGAALGVATFVNATVFRLRWLFGVAAAWWLVSFASFFLMQPAEFILFSAAAILVLQGGTGLALIVLERRRRR